MGSFQRLPAPAGDLKLLRVATIVGLVVTLSVASSSQVVAQDLGGIPPVLPEGLTVDVSLEYYDVVEPTLADVVARLNSTRLEGPDAAPSQGLTQYSVVPRWQARAAGGVCRAEGVEVDVVMTITLPRWPAVGTRPLREQAGWSTIETAIRDHEFVHRDLTYAAAVRLLEKLQGVEARGCRTLSRVVDSRLSIEGHDLREAHEELDRTTPSRLPVG